MRQLIQNVLRGCGYELRRVEDRRTTSPPPLPDLWPWIRQSQQIRTIIDIGANTGDFAAFLFSYFKPQALFAVEPLPSCLPALQEKAAGVKNFHIFNVALSDHEGQEHFYENSYAPSSSLLRVSNISQREFPQTTGETPTVVPVATLDSLLNPADLEHDVFIKIDVQGVEDRVIRGGSKVFAAARSVLVEMSFVPMYDGQSLFEEVHELLVELGFRFAGIKNQIWAASEQPLFAHCLYLRTANRS